MHYTLLTMHYTPCTASFDKDDSSKTFIRGGKPGGEVIGGRAGDVYKLDSKGKGSGSVPVSEMDRMLKELKVRIRQRR